RAPYVMAKPEMGYSRGNKELFDTTIGWRFTNEKLAEMYGADTMPQTAENVAQQFGISREKQDEFAYESQQKAKQAMEADRFADEIVPVVYQDRKGNTITVDTDEHPRPETTLEVLGKLRPIFPGGTVTAGDASGVTDGASGLLVRRAGKAEEMRVESRVRYQMRAVSGLEPRSMGLGPIYATKKAVERAGPRLDDRDLVELNEACACQSWECIRQLELDPERV